ncbi:histidine triad nucleotide-binding protein [Candidatus Gottesmanbacteria bacterium RIFCSPLOWO2_01_FULL_39_12b]|uniref:Histidine triad nucleotide-binding protein n=1 Tax=Candidatus Gottesmanbacteria bacterium RIFCSPLOWO2_01_FULL_39_12b TaxID=1798388 RepID=A0A1F6AQR5_9BACT|nr:MAG: histidine triad nucleotide-binding protein [Candidatus Gottesmanbacteria bacterium RIFCSPLOWO2_01_FULL_39_12b]
MDCIFCKIINGEIPGKFVYRDKNVVAFFDIRPKSPIHLLVMPIKHIESLINISFNDKNLLAEMTLVVVKVANKLGLDKSGYKVIINNGKGSGQVVFHLHMHLLGGWHETPHWQV